MSANPERVVDGEQGATGVVASLKNLIALRDVARWQSKAAFKVHSHAPGQHFSRHKSRGMEFAEARPYQAGDDARMLDWRQTARRGRPYTKLFQEEHERPVQILVDMGHTMRFGTRVAFKSVQAACGAALLAWQAADAGDRVGGLVCSGSFLASIRPQSHEKGVLALLSSLSAASAAPASAQAMDWVGALNVLKRNLSAGTQVVIFSDFYSLDPLALRHLRAFGLRAQLLLVQVYDPLEAQAPMPGHYALTDGHTQANLDLHSAQARGAYSSRFDARRQSLEQLAAEVGARFFALGTHQPPEGVLRALPRAPGLA